MRPSSAFLTLLLATFAAASPVLVRRADSESGLEVDVNLGPGLEVELEVGPKLEVEVEAGDILELEIEAKLGPSTNHNEPDVCRVTQQQIADLAPLFRLFNQAANAVGAKTLAAAILAQAGRLGIEAYLGHISQRIKKLVGDPAKAAKTMDALSSLLGKQTQCTNTDPTKQ